MKYCVRDACELVAVINDSIAAAGALVAAHHAVKYPVIFLKISSVPSPQLLVPGGRRKGRRRLTVVIVIFLFGCGKHTIFFNDNVIKGACSQKK